MTDGSQVYIAAPSPKTEGTATTGADSVESVGGTLRKAREKLGISVAQVSRDLCLKEEVVRALESRVYSALPKVPYCFGFVRTYASYVGLEPEELVHRFKGEIGDVPMAGKLLPPQPLRAGRISASAAVVASLLVAGAAYGAWYYHTAGPVVPTTTADAKEPIPPVPLTEPAAPKSDAAKPTTDPKPTPAAEPAAAPPANAADANKGAATTSAAPGAGPATKTVVVLKASGPCWVYIHNTKGKVTLHKVMQRGEEFQLTDPASDLVIDLGNPGAMQLLVNGKVAKIAVKPGQAPRISLDPKELAKLM